MIDVNLSADQVLRSLRQVGWCEYAVPTEHAKLLARTVELKAAEAGLRVNLEFENGMLFADRIPPGLED